MNNIFNLPTQLPTTELFETLLSQENIVIERIVSQGQITPPGKWYDQDKHEWVRTCPPNSFGGLYRP